MHSQIMLVNGVIWTQMVLETIPMTISMEMHGIRARSGHARPTHGMLQTYQQIPITTVCAIELIWMMMMTNGVMKMRYDVLQTLWTTLQHRQIPITTHCVIR